MRIRRFIAELCSFSHRASCSANEKRAAEHLLTTLRALGIRAWIEPFRSQARMTWELVTIVALPAAGVVLSWWWPVPALIVAIAGLLLFWGHFSVRFKPLAYLFSRATSHNVLGKIENPAASGHVVLSAHYDTARSGFLWHPRQVRNFRLNFLLGAGVLSLIVLLLLARALGVRWVVVDVLLGLGLLYVVGNILVLLHAGLAAPLVQGAADNATGVGVLLDLAATLKKEPLHNYQVWVLATGSEETGLLGMRDFVRRHAHELPPTRTHFLVFDSLGSGQLHYCVGEGMLDLCRFRGPLVELAREVASREPFREVTPWFYRLAQTDALVPARKGYPTLLLLATDAEGLLPHWHWPTDTLDNVDFRVPELASRYALELLRRLDAVAPKSPLS
ncbi:MAG: M28 family metallopeptidase [candidate division KSB1 bacterium]|nr:M28 family metallopeptidase [candidate division KSB1 bacterium]